MICTAQHDNSNGIMRFSVLGFSSDIRIELLAPVIICMRGSRNFARGGPTLTLFFF